MKRVIVIIFAILGIVLGIAFGESVATVKGLEWLSLGGELGFKTPIVLDLNFLQFTIGFWCKINLAGVWGLVIFSLASKKVLDWLKI